LAGGSSLGLLRITAAATLGAQQPLPKPSTRWVLAVRDDWPVPVIDVRALRPQAHEVELVAGLLAEVGEATVADLVADLDLSMASVAGALRTLERSGRARRAAAGWIHIEIGPRAPRRSWELGRGRSG
jgi:hypothetical protein